MIRPSRPLVAIGFLLCSVAAWSQAHAQNPPYDVFPPAEPPYYRVRYDASTNSGELIFPVNYTIWVPEGVKTLRGVVVHQHGCGEGSCRSGLTGAYDLHWQALARKHDCALLSPAYEQPEKADCQMWCDPRNGSAARFQKCLVDLGEKSGHSELARVPWALWGHSGGGHWAGGMMLLHPDRVAAAWLRSGAPLLTSDPERPGIKPHTVPEGALIVPVMCNLGTREGVTVKDDRFAGVWPPNEKFFRAVRGAGGLVGVAVDPLSSHECGNQRYLAIPWLDACLAARLSQTAGDPLKPVPAEQAWLAPILAGEAVPAAKYAGDPKEATWLPNEAIAKAWMQYVKDTRVADETPPPAPTNLRIDGNRLSWDAVADLESGLARFVIERDGEFLANVPEEGKNPFGRALFQNLQYSDTPSLPLVAMQFSDTKAEPGKRHTYRIAAVNTAGLKSALSNEAVALTVDSLGDPLPPGAKLRMGTLRFRPPDNVADLALSPDEATIVTMGRQLIAWDTATGKEHWRANPDFDYPGAGYGIRSLAFFPDGSRFCVPGRNGATLWETATGRHETLAIRRPDSPIAEPRPFRSIDVRPDAKRLALGSAEGIVVCDLQGKISFEISNEVRPPNDGDDRLAFVGSYATARFSPDGRLLAAVLSDKPQEIRLCDSESGRALRTILLKAKLVRLAFSPDSKRIAATERDNAVRVYDVETGQTVWSHVVHLDNIYENYTSAIAFSPDGKVIAAGATDHRIYLLDGTTGEESGRLSGHAWYPWTLAFTADSRMLYSSGWDSAIRRWDVPGKRQLPLPVGIRGSDVATASPDGRTLAYVDDDGEVHLISAMDGTEQRALSLPETGYSQLLFSPDGCHLAGGGTFRDQVHVAIWKTGTGELMHRWDWPKGRDPHSHVESLSFSPDGTRLAAAVFRQGAAYVWDLENDIQMVKLAHRNIYGLSFASDGKTLATAGWDSKVRFWDTESGEMQREVEVVDKELQRDVRMYAVQCSPDGELVATAHLDGTVRVWRLEDMSLHTRFQVEGRFIYGAMSFSPDGLWLATGAMNGSVGLWDPLTGKQAQEIGRHGSYVHMVGFGRDARTVLSAGSDGLAYLWDARPANVPAGGDPARLWDDLASDDPLTAHRAIWALTEMPKEAAPILSAKMRPVRTLVDPTRVPQGTSPEEAERLKRLRKLLAEKEEKVELSIVARRALSVLAQLDAPEARETLRTLATENPETELSRLASAALKQSTLPN